MKNQFIRAPFILFISLLLLIYLIQLLPKTAILPDFFHYMGWLLVILSFCTALSCKQLFLQHKTSFWKSNPTYLITERFFRYSRNPFYLIQLTFLTGTGLLTKNPLSLLAAITFYYLCDKWIIPIEERLMIRTFGMDYLDYKENVRRWLSY